MSSKGSKPNRSFVPTRRSPLASGSPRKWYTPSSSPASSSPRGIGAIKKDAESADGAVSNSPGSPINFSHYDEISDTIANNKNGAGAYNDHTVKTTLVHEYGLLSDSDYDQQHDENENENDGNQEDETEDVPVLNNLSDTLQKCLFLEGAPKAFYSAIMSNIKLITHHPQQYIVRFGEPSKALYILLKGTVAVTSPDGETLHAELQPGAYFGEIGVLFSRPRTATVIAKTKTLLAIVTKETLNLILPNYPYIERSIRDEAQKRLASQENKRSKKLSAQFNLSHVPPKQDGVPDISHGNDKEKKKSIILPSILNSNMYSSMSVSDGLQNSNNEYSNTIQNYVATEETFKELLVDLFIPLKKFIDKLNLLNVVPYSVLYEFTINCTKILYRNPNEHIFRKGDLTSEVYFILEGQVEIVDSVQIYLQNSELRGTKFEKVLAKLGQYEYFGEMAFIQHFADTKLIPLEIKGVDFRFRSADVRAATPVKLLVFPYDELKRFCEKYTAVFTGFKEEALRRCNANKSTLGRSSIKIPSIKPENVHPLQEQASPASISPVVEEPVGKLNEALFGNFGFNKPNNTNKAFFPHEKRESPKHKPAFSVQPSATPASSTFKWNSSFLNNSASVFSSPHSSSSRSIPSKASASATSSVFSSRQRRSSVASSVMSSDTKGSSEVQQMQKQQLSFREPFSHQQRQSMQLDSFAKVKKRRRSAFELSNADALYASGNRFYTHEPLLLVMPPLNPVTPSLHNFPGQNYAPRQPFQYVTPAKRLKYFYLNNNNIRRRSSLLRYRPTLPDHILIRIFQQLDLKTLMVLRRANQRWRQILYLAPDLFKTLDLSMYHTAMTDEILVSVADFVGPRPNVVDISNCYHITDKGFSYLINEIGINGRLKVIKMKSVWHVNAMSIMDLAAPSVGRYLEEVDFSNCKKVRDEVLERLIGANKNNNAVNYENETLAPYIFNDSFRLEQSFGCLNLKKLNLSYCKYVTDKTMYYIANYMNDRLEYFNIKRCTTITDKGFSHWLYKRFPKLKSLNLSDCTFLTSNSISAIAFAAGGLEELDLSFCCALNEHCLDILRVGCPYLQKLNLSFCGNAVSDNSLLSLSLSSLNLKELVLKGCIRVTRAGVDILLSGCCPLKYLDISQCKYAHVYPGNIEAVKLPVKAGTRSSFITISPEKGVVEIVL